MAERRRRAWLEAGAVVLFAAAATVWVTWPLAARMGQLARAEGGDGQFSIWNVAWVAHALSTDPLRVLDANIFYPHRNTLLFSEANLGAGLLAVPAYRITGDPIVTHNSAFFASFVLTVVAMYYLARHLTGSRAAAVPSAVMVAFCPYLFAHTAHIQLLMIFGLPLCLLAMLRFVDRPNVARTVSLGVALAVQALFCGYYGVLAGLLVGLGVLFYAAFDGRWRQPRWWALSAGAAGVAALLVGPLALAYRELQSTGGFARSLSEAERYSADWRAYFASNGQLHTWMLPLLGHWNAVLFPGFLALGLGLTATVLYMRPSRRRDPTSRYVAFFLLLLAFGLWLSFGPKAGLYAVLYQILPVFSFLRAPARFGVTVVLALGALSAFAVAALLRGRRRAWQVAVSGVLTLGALVELKPIRLPLRPVEPPPPVYRALSHLPAGVVVEFPFFYDSTFYFRHSWYMLQSTWHWKPLVNGYSDHIPEDFRRMAVPLSSFPNREGFRILQPREARYAVFHLNWYNQKLRNALLQRLDQYRDYLRLLLRDRDTLLYEIVQWP